MRTPFRFVRFAVLAAVAAASLGAADMDLRLVRPAVIGGQEAVACSEDYRPCVCGNYPHVGVCVVCDAVTIDELQAVLERTAERDIFWLQVVPAPVPDGRVLVPGDVLRGKRVRAIDFYCPSPPHRLEIDPGAFRSSFDSTEHFYVMDCRLAGETRLEFLAGFHRLAHLYLYGSASAGGLAELPLLAALAELTVQKSAGLAQGFPARSLPKLRRLDLTDNALDDAQVDRILATLDASGIQVLSLAYNRLTLVPAPLASFARLSDLSLSGNRIASVGGGRLKLSAPKIDRLVLTNTSLGSIEPQAIEGNVVHADLSRNNLSRLDRHVFEPLLRRIQSNNGSLVIDSNPLDCCGLAWLVGSDLMPFVVGGKCTDGTRIDQLGPHGLEECPASRH